jgi:tRNA threonylcarbamoyladenosine biosynthesis protein TsaE
LVGNLQISEQHPLHDAGATRALGAALAERLLAAAADPPLLLLQGDLGAGKTCLVQGLAAALGIEEPITSPTFALAQHYHGRLASGRATALVHLDLYRLEQPAAADELLAQEEEEARELGALLAVEWPERLSRLPADAWLLQLQLADPDDPDAGRVAHLSR